MGDFVLKLTADGKEDICLELVDSPPDASIVPPLDGEGADGASAWIVRGKQAVFSDVRYEMELCGQQAACVYGAELFVNGESVPSTYRAGRIWISQGAPPLFADCYGFVSLSLRLYTEQGEYMMYTADLPVLVKQGAQSDALKAMIGYVKEHIGLFAPPAQGTQPTPRSDGRRRDLEAAVSQAERIAAVCEANWGYFKSNSRFTLEHSASVESFDHLCFIGERTLRFIACHPEQLSVSTTRAGLKVGSGRYLPQKTLVEHSQRSFDIYENRVIAVFLKTMLANLATLHKRCAALLACIPSERECTHKGYVYSPSYMFSETKARLELCRVRLASLEQKVESLLWMYCEAFSFAPQRLSAPLGQVTPTAIFLSVPQYNAIYECICRWRQFASYDLGAERYMLSFTKVSLLYESYVLAKLLAYFGECGFRCTSAKRFAYRLPTGAKFKGATCNNTFVFTNSRYQLTLYYQPVIFDGGSGFQNNIGLYKNNSVLPAGYCTPDFILKAQSEEGTTYLLMDAKFSSARTVRIHRLQELVFKYLFSVSASQPTARVVGLCVLYGKTHAKGQMQSAYDKQLAASPIVPCAELLPIAGNEEDKTSFPLLTRLLKKLMA